MFLKVCWLTLRVNDTGIIINYSWIKQLCTDGMSPKQVEIFVVIECVGLTFPSRGGKIIKKTLLITEEQKLLSSLFHFGC